MDFTAKQLESTLRKIIRTERLATRADLDAVEDTMAQTVNRAFQHVEDRISDKLEKMDQKLDRIERVVSKWPAPSELDQLFVRIAAVERHLGIKSQSPKAA